MKLQNATELLFVSWRIKVFVYQNSSSSRRALGEKGSDFYLWCLVKIHCILNYLKDNRLFIMKNYKSIFTCANFKSNPPSAANTAKFDCLDLSGPPCRSIKFYLSYLMLMCFKWRKIFLEEYQSFPKLIYCGKN